MSNRVLALLAVGCFVGSANAALFSFASDNDHTSWTFTGNGGSVRDASDPMDPQILLIDDHNGPLPAIPLAVEFQADFQISYIASVPLGGAFIHNYSLNGTFSFVDGSGNAVLTATVTNGALTAIGDALSWYSTATIQATDGNSNTNNSVVYTWNGGDMPGYDLLNGVSIGPDDMAFTLSSLNSDAMDVVLDPTTHLPTHIWQSEGSYSGTDHFVPAPGAAMILGLGGLFAIRRRR